MDISKKQWRSTWGKNQHIYQGKFLNIENWTNREPCSSVKMPSCATLLKGKWVKFVTNKCISDDGNSWPSFHLKTIVLPKIFTEN